MNLPLDVVLLVLLAALMHAAWNAIVKSSQSKFLDTMMVAIVPGLIALVTVPFLQMPAPASWPWLLASVAIHFLYYLAVAGALRHGDLSHVYPLMRGCAPLFVALASFAGLVDQLTASMWAGVILISAGIIAPVLLRRNGVGMPARGTVIAVGNAVIIGAYTVVDGNGTRLSGDPISYGQWLFLLNAMPLAMFAFAWRRKQIGAYVRERWAMGLVGGVLSMGSYAIVLWAMTRAPVAGVAALRETSVIFAAFFGSFLLREGSIAPRVAGAILVVCGIAAFRL
ncbi:MAG: putative transrane protein [Betaproteobacteria bacterium]|nr:putative transrane protein [Betaproteobacteria bacterium]